VAVLNLLARRSRQRESELFEDCSDDDLMDWGRELSDDDDPIFAELRSLPPEPVAEAGPRLALPQPGVHRN
jgi:hypothetical protein